MSSFGVDTWKLDHKQRSHYSIFFELSTLSNDDDTYFINEMVLVGRESKIGKKRKKKKDDDDDQPQKKKKRKSQAVEYDYCYNNYVACA